MTTPRCQKWCCGTGKEENEGGWGQRILDPPCPIHKNHINHVKWESHNRGDDGDGDDDDDGGNDGDKMKKNPKIKIS